MPDRDEYPLYYPTCEGTELGTCFDSGGSDYYRSTLPIRSAEADLEAFMSEHLRTCDHAHTVRVRFGWKMAEHNYEYDYPTGGHAGSSQYIQEQAGRG